jgi:hypothetical protein
MPRRSARGQFDFLEALLGPSARVKADLAIIERLAASLPPSLARERIQEATQRARAAADDWQQRELEACNYPWRRSK